jgi:hypothetical protein
MDRAKQPAAEILQNNVLDAILPFLQLSVRTTMSNLAAAANNPARTDLLSLQNALNALQSTAANFAAMCINDSKVRAQYMRDIAAASAEMRQAVESGKFSAREAAEAANNMRNQLLELSRLRSSPTARAYATKLKKDGLSLGKLGEKYAQQLFHKPFVALTESQQASVYREIVNGAGRGNSAVAALAKTLGRAGKRLLLVSLAVASYEVCEAEDKPREVARQGGIAVAGIAGGWAAGSGTVAAGLCAATAPICVGVAALIGGILFTSGADLAFGTMYPQPAAR